MNRLAVTTIAVALLLLPSTAIAKKSTTARGVLYGKQAGETATVYPGGPVPLLLLHEKGEPAGALASKAGYLQSSGFTVFNLEWEVAPGKAGIFPFETNQIQEAVAYVQGHAAKWSVVPGDLVMVGGSRGALIAMLAAERANAAKPGSVRAVAALSGQVNPQASIERARRKELVKVMTGNLAEAFGCEHDLSVCPEAYVREWSPLLNVTSSAPAMFLTAATDERRASAPDQFEMAEALQRRGVHSSVVIPDGGHGYGYWGQVREPLVAFLSANGK
ncbi:MAG TPA: alpha/beta hydrolase [Solirubrobacteraceae bacterium]|jgi:acetyl esterase/lipase|nr:alpha/beta hydrolase [Solirubrobacteraceae bacterium]